MKNVEYKYDVALSFAGEDRSYVEKVAEILKESNIRVFYDKFEESNLWGKNLYTYLDDIYGKQALYTVIFCSQHYAKKLWPNHERESAQERAFKDNHEYILPARFDQTDIPGIRTTTGYINLDSKTPLELCYLISEKLGKRLSVKFYRYKKTRPLPRQLTRLGFEPIRFDEDSETFKDHIASFQHALLYSIFNIDEDESLQIQNNYNELVKSSTIYEKQNLIAGLLTNYKDNEGYLIQHFITNTEIFVDNFDTYVSRFNTDSANLVDEIKYLVANNTIHLELPCPVYYYPILLGYDRNSKSINIIPRKLENLSGVNFYRPALREYLLYVGSLLNFDNPIFHNELDKYPPKVQHLLAHYMDVKANPEAILNTIFYSENNDEYYWFRNDDGIFYIDKLWE